MSPRPHRRCSLALPAAALLLLQGACADVQQILASAAVREPRLTFKDARLRDASFEGATIDLVFTIENPTAQAISLGRVDYLLKVEGKQLVAGRPPAGLRIPSGQGDVTFPAEVRFADLASSVTALLGKRVIAYQASGTVGVETPLGPLLLPLQQSGTLELPRLPALSIGAPRLQDVSLTGATLLVPLQVENPNAFPLPLGGLTGQLLVEGRPVGALRAAALPTVAATGTGSVALPVRIDFLQALDAAAALRSGKATLALQGQLGTGRLSIPFDLQQTVEIGRE